VTGSARALVLLVAALGALGAGGDALAQAGPVPADRAAAAGAASIPVAAVRLDGVAGPDSARTLSGLGIRPGEAVTAARLREALRAVWALGMYDDFWVGLRQEEGGTALTLHVAPRPRLARVELTGNHKLDSDKLLEHTGLVVGGRLSNDQVLAAVDSVRRIYREKGYVRAQVTATTQSAGPGQAVVAFRVVEGSAARLAGVAFPGAVSFPPDLLRKQLESKFKGFLRGGKLDPDKVGKDVEQLTAFYRDRGFREVEVARDSLRFSPDGQRMTLVYNVQEGPRAWLGEVQWAGNRALGDAQVRALTQIYAGQMYNASAIRKTVEEAYSQYAELGFLYVSVDPVEQVNDSGRVELTFQVQEGAPSHLRRINISGNTRTKEKVVRRELMIHEGDLFRRSALIRTQQDVFRLGYFQDVQVDFKPADSTDVDLSLKVVEKETGTASAGAGYSSDGGLTGFVTLGHNNLFGNGQAATIQLERGARRSNIDVSFTDPYFRDTRTTLGVSVFSRDRETQIVGTGTSRLDYREVRRGGSVRLGRPLVFVDRYTRGFVTYRLEGVDLKLPGGVASYDSAQIALANYVSGGAQTTSLVELALRRDNTINPFYPTGGSRLNAASEFAGGPLGGQVTYNKSEYDARWYRPVNRRLTAMLRWRGGFLSGYGKTPPPYETFRLGGTTYYGVRGYEDYAIVPDENIRTIYTTIVVNDSLGMPIDSVRTSSRVAYPGGRWMQMLTLEGQFPIVHPVHGVVFFDAGATWNEWRDIQLLGDLYRGVGAGVRVEVPLLGNLGLDMGYGFDRLRPGWRTHFLLGNMFF
jgi:outer membrane protein insertion porin family